jgi:hypothetical protein
MQIYLRFAEPQPNFAAFAATLVQGERKCKFICVWVIFGANVCFIG